MTQTEIKPNLKLVKFGVRVSEDHPTFQIGDVEFETRLITMGEDRGLSKRQAQFPKADKDPETGEELPLTSEQEEEIMTIMAGMTADLLARRVKNAELKDSITQDWVIENMLSNDFGPLMFFLRKGYEQPETLLLEPEDLGDDLPNAEL